MADDMGLGNKGSFQPEGALVVTPIDAGMPSGGSPGDGSLAPGPTAGGGTIGANGSAPIK